MNPLSKVLLLKVDATEAAPGGLFGKWIKALLAIWVILGMSPIVPRMLGYAFLPSIKWMALSEVPGLVAGLISAVLLLWIYL